MSKIYKKFQELKSNNNNPNTLYLFKSGIFFILVDSDAIILSNLLHLKLSKLNDEIVKCGFPISSFEKYTKLISNTSYNFQIVDLESNSIFNCSEYLNNENIKRVIQKILDVNIDSLSISECYDFLYKLQNELNCIIRGNEIESK